MPVRITRKLIRVMEDSRSPSSQAASIPLNTGMRLPKSAVRGAPSCLMERFQERKAMTEAQMPRYSKAPTNVPLHAIALDDKTSTTKAGSRNSVPKRKRAKRKAVEDR